ncbi:MAG: hypothetical protein AVDCRST_MAG50-199, partial [uncultured Acidimicrobiales bacterium]
ELRCAARRPGRRHHPRPAAAPPEPPSPAGGAAGGRAPGGGRTRQGRGAAGPAPGDRAAPGRLRAGDAGERSAGCVARQAPLLRRGHGHPRLAGHQRGGGADQGTDLAPGGRGAPDPRRDRAGRGRDRRPRHRAGASRRDGCPPAGRDHRRRGRHRPRGGARGGRALRRRRRPRPRAVGHVREAARPAGWHRSGEVGGRPLHRLPPDPSVHGGGPAQARTGRRAGLLRPVRPHPRPV